MHELFELLQENRLTVINLANDKYKLEFTFNDDENAPLILVQDNDGEIEDKRVIKARIANKLDKNGKPYQTLEFLIEDYEDWENDCIALSTTANNVYNAIYMQLEKIVEL